MGATDRFLKRGRIQDFSRSPIAKMLSELKKFGANGHLYIPGVGAISGITAGNYLDSIGTTNASVDGNVGLVLDGAGSVGAELFPVLNFNSVWTAIGTAAATANNAFSMTGSAGSGFAIQPLTVGKTYRLRVNFTKSVGANLIVSNSNSSAYPIVAADAATTGGVLEGNFKAETAYIYFRLATASGSIVVNSFSVREVTGIHASQATTGYQPKLRRGLVNNQLNSVPIGGQWVAEATGTGVVPTVTYNYATAPDGSPAARAILDKGAGATSADLSQFRAGNSTVVSGAPYTSAIWLRTTVEGTTAAVSLRDNIAASTLTVTDQWQLFVRSGNAISNIMSVGVRLRPTEATNSQADILVGAAGIFQGTLTAQQILAAGGIPVTTSAPASSSSGAYKLDFDGTDDFMSLGSVPFQMADDHYTAIALTPNAINTGKHVLNPANGAASQQVGNISVDGNSKYITRWCDDATNVLGVADAVTVAPGVASVLASRRVGTMGVLRKNGAQVGSISLASLGATTLTLPGVIGSYKTGVSPSAISLHGVAVIKGTVTDAQALIFERGLNAIAQYAAGRF